MVRLLKLAFRTALHFRRTLTPAFLIVIGSSFLLTFAGAAVEPIRETLRSEAARLESVAVHEGILAGPGTSYVPQAVSVLAAPTGDTLTYLASWLGEENVTHVAIVPGDPKRGQHGTLTSDDARETTSTPRDREDTLLLLAGSDTPLLLERAPVSDSATWARPASTSPGPLIARERLPQVLVLSGLVDGVKATGGSEATTIVREDRLVRALLILAAVLATIAAIALAPAVALVARRASGSFSLLAAWGFGRRTRRIYLLALAGTAALLSSAAGGAAALITAGILNTGERAAVSLVPSALLPERGSSLAEMVLAAAVEATPIAPSVGYFMLGVGVFTLLGVVSALPSLAIADRVRPRSSLWRW